MLEFEVGAGPVDSLDRREPTTREIPNATRAAATRATMIREAMT
jgi:hypothetical protein